MKKFYCTIWDHDDQVSGVYHTAEAAQNRVLDILLELDEHPVESRDELREICESVDWNSYALGFGMIEIEAEDEDECYEIYI